MSAWPLNYKLSIFACFATSGDLKKASPVSCPCLQWCHMFKPQGERKPNASISWCLFLYLYFHICLPTKSLLSQTHTHQCIFFCLFSVFLCICVYLSVGLPFARVTQSVLLIQGQECALSGPVPDPGERSALKVQLWLLTKPHCSYAYHLATSLST